MTVKELRKKLFEIEDQQREITAEELAGMMSEEYGNNSIINIELTRIEVCDLLIACTTTRNTANDGGRKWERLHDNIKQQLKETDKEHGWA